MESKNIDVERQHGLSKSRISAFEQCPKRLWLQVHRPDLAEIDASKELRFAAGHEVGEVACSLVPNGIMIEAEPDLAAALARTTELLQGSERVPLFEATFVHDGVLVRLDIMEPADEGAWQVAEVKSATSRKDCYVPDLATQLWVLRHNDIQVSSAVIRHVNNQFVLEDECEFAGLMVDVPTLDDAQGLVRTRAGVVKAARAVLSGPEPERDIGEHCNSPYSCEFNGHCTQLAPRPEWPIGLLPNTGRKLAAKWAEHGVTDLMDIPADGLSPLHARIHQATRTSTPYHDLDGVLRVTADWGWPRSFLDFETIAFAVPKWLGTRPWQQIPFQFSLHIEREAGDIEHRELLCLTGRDPRREIAEALLRATPRSGAIIAYNASFERSCVKQLASALPDLASQLERLADRIVDLLPVTRNHWYHRDQRGSWSIKAVLPTLSDAAGYSELNVQDGSAAQAAYLEAIHPNSSEARREAIDRDLRDYCALDTRAMVTLLHFLAGQKLGI